MTTTKPWNLQELFAIDNISSSEKIEISERWVQNLVQGLSEIVQRDIADPKIPLQWTQTDIQWDKTISWLYSAHMRVQSGLPYIVLLWLATDISHGFWQGKRNRAVQNITNFSWALRARMGVVQKMLMDAHGNGEQVGWAFHPLIITMFANPLIFQVHPNTKLLDVSSAERERQNLMLEKMLSILELPITTHDIQQLCQFLEKMYKERKKIQQWTVTESVQCSLFWETIADSNIISGDSYVFSMSGEMYLDGLSQLIAEPSNKEKFTKEFSMLFDSLEHAQAIIQSTRHLLHAICIFEQSNALLQRLSLSQVGGVGEDFF